MLVELKFIGSGLDLAPFYGYISTELRMAMNNSFRTSDVSTFI
jgi:hypothetical protein